MAYSILSLKSIKNFSFRKKTKQKGFENFLKALVLLVAGAGFEPTTFRL